MEHSAPLSAAVLLDALASLGTTHLIALPDNGSAALLEGVAGHQAIELLSVTREGEAFAIAAGLWLGGKRPVVVIQNTGLLESGDAVRGTAVRMGVPLLFLVGVRGYAKMIEHGADIDVDEETELLAPSTMRRHDVDSVALLTEPTLKAWGIPHHTYAADDDVPRVIEAWRQAEAQSRPVAVLLPRPLS